MDKKKRLKKIIFLCSVMLLIPSFVNAKSVKQNELCIDTGNGSNFYQLKSSFGSKVQPSKIIYQDITGTDKYPELCFCSADGDNCLKKDVAGNPTNQCANEYKFVVESQALSCKVDNRENDSYSFFICPDSNSYNVVRQMQNGMKIEYVSSSNQYKVTFSTPNAFKGKVSAKLVRKVRKNGVSVFDINKDTGLPESNSSILREYSAGEVDNGIYFSPGSEFYLIFYLSDSIDGCNGERLGYIMGAVPSTVPNPMYQNAICTNFRSKYASGSVERIMVSACDETVIQYSELSTIESTIRSKIAEVEELQKKIASTVKPSDNFTCLFKESLNSTNNLVNTQLGFSTKSGFLDIAGTGTYWKAFCTETISIEYDDPKAIKAGNGFKYDTKAVINRTCTPVKISEPKYLPNCSYSVECWGGPANHNGESGAGPNEDFDSCINTCDGGTYTQNCINSCYNKIYGNSLFSYKSREKLSSTTFVKNGRSNYELTRIVSKKGNTSLIGTTDGGQTRLPISSGCIISGNNIDNGCGTSCWDREACRTEHGVVFTYLDGCNANGETSGTKCYEVFTNWPCDEGEHYREDILASEAEYNTVVSEIQKFSETEIANEKYEIVIDEDYNQQKNNNYDHKTTTFSNSGGDYTIHTTTTIENIKNTFDSNTRLADPNVGELDDSFIHEHIYKDVYSYQLARTIELKIGAAYLSRVDGNDVIYNEKETLTNPDLDNNDRYFEATNKYFTRLDTRIINNYLEWPYYNSAVTSDSTAGYTKNIHVRLHNIGSWNQWGTEGNGVNVDCIYGVAPGIVNTEDNSSEGKGIRYIFRPINLGDMFPNNRNPRFNWTGTVNHANNTSTGAALTLEKSRYSTDAVDPEVLIQTIESKNESIYEVSKDSSEVDYEFVLIKENIRNIRKYNKNVRDYNGDGSKNYLDYNMSCYKNARGQEICTSRFLDNVDGNSGSDTDGAGFITYSVNGYGITERKSIAGCNNAIYGTECDIISR